MPFDPGDIIAISYKDGNVQRESVKMFFIDHSIRA